MTESELWKMLKPGFDGLGVAMRLENTAGASVPDVLLVSEGVFVFVELKISHGNKIYCPPFQWALALKMRKHIREHNHWYCVAVDRRSPMRMFTLMTLLKCTDPVYTHGKLEINLNGVKPDYTLNRTNDLKHWFNHVENHEYERLS